MFVLARGSGFGGVGVSVEIRGVLSFTYYRLCENEV